MQQVNTYFELVKNTSELGFCERFSKICNEKLQSNSTKKQYSKDEIFPVFTIPCPTDKSTLYLVKTSDGTKGIYIDYWEARVNF